MNNLDCIYDSRQSFYGKAKYILQADGTCETYRLYSYGTEVARVEVYRDMIKYFYYGKYSQTTTRHQKEFFKQHDISNHEMEKLFKEGKLVRRKEDFYED